MSELSEYIKHARHFDGLGMGDAELESQAKVLEDQIKEFVDRIEKLEDTIAELESESTGDKISLAKCHERSRGKDKRIANLQATITKLEAELEFMKNNWVNPTGEE